MKIISIIFVSVLVIFLIIYGISKIPKTEYMTNDEIISESKKCTDAGLKAHQVINGFNLQVRYIICR